MSTVESIDQLRSLYAMPKGRAVQKQLAFLDQHCRKFISLSPFLVIASSSAIGAMDASPRGGPAGFVKVLDEHTLLIPDAPGNNRLDTLENIIANGKVGLIFMIPGIDETLRVNGSARLSSAGERIDLFATEKRRPKLVIEISVAEAYLHCAKALMRSDLWAPSSRTDRSALPTMGEMINSQTGVDAPAESQQDMLARYAADL